MAPPKESSSLSGSSCVTDDSNIVDLMDSSEAIGPTLAPLSEPDHHHNHPDLDNDDDEYRPSDSNDDDEYRPSDSNDDDEYRPSNSNDDDEYRPSNSNNHHDLPMFVEETEVKESSADNLLADEAGDKADDSIEASDDGSKPAKTRKASDSIEASDDDDKPAKKRKISSKYKSLITD